MKHNEGVVEMTAPPVASLQRVGERLRHSEGAAAPAARVAGRVEVHCQVDLQVAWPRAVESQSAHRHWRERKDVHGHGYG
jgi:hypothetical protein